MPGAVGRGGRGSGDRAGGGVLREGCAGGRALAATLTGRVERAGIDAGARDGGPTRPERGKLARLRERNRRLHMARDILSKAFAPPTCCRGLGWPVARSGRTGRARLVGGHPPSSVRGRWRATSHAVRPGRASSTRPSSGMPSAGGSSAGPWGGPRTGGKVTAHWLAGRRGHRFGPSSRRIGRLRPALGTRGIPVAGMTAKLRLSDEEDVPKRRPIPDRIRGWRSSRQRATRTAPDAAVRCGVGARM